MSNRAYGYGYDYGGSAYSYSPPYGHGQSAGYGLGTAPTASYFITELDVGESESFARQSGYRSSSVYAVHDAGGISYGRYSTYNSSSGLYHVDTEYGHPGPDSGFSYSTYYALHSDSYFFFEQSTIYNYYPGGGYPSYLVDQELKQYSYADGSSLDIADYFRSDSTHADGGSFTTVDQSEAQTSTDAHGYSTYNFASSEHTLSF